MKRLLMSLIGTMLAAFPAFGASRSLTVHVNGMVCQFCSQGITKKFKAQNEVESVHVDMEKKEVHLVIKEGADLGDSTITELIRDSGVNVEKIVR